MPFSHMNMLTMFILVLLLGINLDVVEVEKGPWSKFPGEGAAQAGSPVVPSEAGNFMHEQMEDVHQSQ